MAIFSHKTKPAAVAETKEKTNLAKEAISSVISDKMKIYGEIAFKGKARIDGELEGNLEGEYLVLSETGAIQGDLQLVTLICHGKINGSIAAGSVIVHSTATINGKVIAESLTVEPGAAITGEVYAAKDTTQQTPKNKIVTEPGNGKKGRENKKKEQDKEEEKANVSGK
ncbi:MAG: cell shape determination protein CcmA [Desulfobulbus propionicus]|nr:MAG: cell shape determination protein CcmA [Desulfobulbus propionicus]